MPALIVILGLVGCATYPPPLAPGPVVERACSGTGRVTHSVFLIGDAGDPELPNEDAETQSASVLIDPVLLRLQEHVERRAAKLGPDSVVVVFLGDNVYPAGLPPPGESGREHAERVLRAQIASVGPAQGYFLAGNHDWHREGDRGFEYVVAQREFLDPFAPRISMFPPGGCAGPRGVDVGRHLRLVFFDFIGALHLYDYPDHPRQGCSQNDVLNAFLALEKELEGSEGRHIAFLNHYPIVTAGPHGGHFTWREHIFPLTEFFPWAWIPLPVIGSLYPLSRQLGVTGTDMSSDQYQVFMRAFFGSSRILSPLLVAAGHEHSLQVHRDFAGMYYAVSGAGSASKVDRVDERDTMLMGVAEPGHMRLDALSDGALELSVFTLLQNEPIYRHCLADGPP